MVSGAHSPRMAVPHDDRRQYHLPGFPVPGGPLSPYRRTILCGARGSTWPQSPSLLGTAPSFLGRFFIPTRLNHTIPPAGVPLHTSRPLQRVAPLVKAGTEGGHHRTRCRWFGLSGAATRVVTARQREYGVSPAIACPAASTVRRATFAARFFSSAPPCSGRHLCRPVYPGSPP